MPTQYTLTVTNNSSAFENFSVYQQDPDLGNANAVNVAWLADAADPGTEVSFDWSLPPAPKAMLLATQPKYWLAAGKLEPGTVSDPAQMTDAVEIVFPPGVHTMQVTLNPDNTWTIAPAAD
jgi:hypothetical protein